MTLYDFLKWLATAGAGGAAYWLMENLSGLAALKPEAKRYVAWALASGLACAAYGALVALGYEPPPQTWQAWLENLFTVAAAACGLSQVIHGRKVLARKVTYY